MRSLKRTFGFILQHPLAKTNLPLAFWRFFSWQLRSRFIAGLTVVPFLQNVKTFAKKGLTGVTGNIYTGLHEFEDMGFLLHFLCETDVFFDVGANVGSYTLLASGVKRCKTFAFEPAREAFSILIQNIALNNLGNQVTAIHKGVGSKPGNVRFTKGRDTTNQVLTGDGPAEEADLVSLVTLDEYYPGTLPALIKIDVEGFEMEVIRGAKILLKHPGVKALILELNGSGTQYGFADEEIHRELLDLQFLPVTYDPFTRTLTPRNGYGDKNTVYIRDLEFVQSRVSNAAPFTVLGRTV